MTVAPNRRKELVDVRELRATGKFEIRAAGTGELELAGYASTFEPYDIYGGPAKGGWIEQLDPRAFDRTLREKPDLHLLINHEGMPLARTKSGTLILSVDTHGLRVEAKLDRSDPDVQRLETKMARGDMDEMSFAFRVTAQTWSAAPNSADPQSHRMITEVNLHKGDVSVVNFGANPTTHAEVLGRRKKRGQMTLSLAEAIALEAAGTTGAAAPRRSKPKGEGTAAAAIRMVEAAAKAERASRVASDSITARAEEILDNLGGTSGSTRSADVSVYRLSAMEQGLGVGAILPPAGELLKADAADRRDRRRAVALAELDRQRCAITDDDETGSGSFHAAMRR
ncbi:hypothetical protein BH09ACT7_BH09ACT7_05060 [soil metagenome]